MKTLAEVLQLSTAFLGQRRPAEELLAHVLEMKRIDLYLQFDRPIEEKELASLRPLLKRSHQGEPLQYILGEISFFGAQIRTDRRALIPRQETEILADLIAKRIRGNVLWDLCAGTGCLAISLKKKFPSLSVALSDLSSEALSLAKENVLLNRVDVELYQGDLFAPFAGKCADMIVCNPPYVSASEYGALEPSVRKFEPKEALLAGKSGLEFYERLAAEFPLFLNPRGQLFLEIGASQGEAVKKIFSGGEVLQDWSGKDRFFFLENQVDSPVCYSSKTQSEKSCLAR